LLAITSLKQKDQKAGKKEKKKSGLTEESTSQNLPAKSLSHPKE